MDQSEACPMPITSGMCEPKQIVWIDIDKNYVIMNQSSSCKRPRGQKAC